MTPSSLIVFCTLISTGLSIECYSGLKFIAGTSVGTTTISCGDSAYCYNMTANAAVLIDVVKAGCSMWRCMLARDKCISTVFQTVPISLCCCSGDRCNVGENYGLNGNNNWNSNNNNNNNNNNQGGGGGWDKQEKTGGWNAEPQNQRIWTKDEVSNAFKGAELDDDHHTTSRPNRHGGSATNNRGAEVEIP